MISDSNTCPRSCCMHIQPLLRVATNCTVATESQEYRPSPQTDGGYGSSRRLSAESCWLQARFCESLLLLPITHHAVILFMHMYNILLSPCWIYCLDWSTVKTAASSSSSSRKYYLKFGISSRFKRSPMQFKQASSVAS